MKGVLTGVIGNVVGLSSVELEKTIDGNLVVGQNACCSECATKGDVQPGHFACDEPNDLFIGLENIHIVDSVLIDNAWRYRWNGNTVILMVD